MRWKLLARVLWSRYRKPALLLAALGMLGSLAWSVSSSSCPSREGCPCEGGPAANESESLLFDRVWLDRYPEEPRDELALWVFLSDGIGAYQQGSAFRGSFDVFALERQDDALELSWMQDEVVDRTRFTVERCDERPPFDLCLTLESPARGPSRYYGLSDEQAEAAHFPWAARVLDRARAAR